MKLNFYVILLFLIIGCGGDIVEEVIESYSEDAPKQIHFVSGEGEEKIILKKITLKKNGDTLNINEGDSLIITMDYYNTDTLKSISSYLYNEKSGEWKYFHKNGAVDCIMYYNKNIVNGTYQEFYENGKKAITGFYIDGIREDLWKFYDSDGEMAGEYKYLSGDVYFSSGYYIDTEYVD